MGTPPGASATLEEHFGAGGTQALLTTLQRLAQAASTPPQQREYRELSLGLQILLKGAGQADVISPPTLLALQEFPAPVFKPLPAALPPLAGPAGIEVDAEEVAPAALEESGDSADEVDEVMKAPANSRKRPSARQAVELLEEELGSPAARPTGAGSKKGNVKNRLMKKLRIK